MAGSQMSRKIDKVLNQELLAYAEGGEYPVEHLFVDVFPAISPRLSRASRTSKAENSGERLLRMLSFALESRSPVFSMAIL